MGWLTEDMMFYVIAIVGIICYTVVKMVKLRHQHRLERDQQRRRLDQGDYTCQGCSHNLSFHDPDTKQCNAKVKQASKWEYDPDYHNQAVASKFEYVQCSCRQYVGDQPVQSILDSFPTPHRLPASDPAAGEEQA